MHGQIACTGSHHHRGACARVGRRGGDAGSRAAAELGQSDRKLGEGGPAPPALDRLSAACTLPDQKACTIEQPAGRTWREFHEVTLRWIGAVAMVGMLGVLVIFYLIRGMVRIKAGRFRPDAGAVQRVRAVRPLDDRDCFIVLAITGVNITFGKELLLPLIGPDAFSTWSQWAKYSHNYLSFPFTIGVVLIFLIWIAGNIPNRVDVEWLKRGGGIVGDDDPAGVPFQRRAKGDLLDRGAGRHCLGDHRVSADVPVLRHRHRRHATGPGRSRHGRGVVRRRHAGAHLHWHHRHGGSVRGHGHRRGGRQLGKAAPQSVARGGTGPPPAQTSRKPSARARAHATPAE